MEEERQRRQWLEEVNVEEIGMVELVLFQRRLMVTRKRIAKLEDDTREDNFDADRTPAVVIIKDG